MKITVNFDHNWTNDEIKSLIENPNLTARELNMDTDAYLEALIVASLMKRSSLSETDAINAGSAELASGIEDHFFEEMFENYTDHYKQMLNSAV